MVDTTDYSNYCPEFMKVWVVRREELVRAGKNNLAELMESAYYGWVAGQTMLKTQEIDFTKNYEEMKRQSFHPSGLAGYRLGLTDAQAIMHNHGIVNIRGPIANKPKDFKE